MSYAIAPPVPNTNPNAHLYTPNGWDAGYKAAKAGIAAGILNVAFFGESTMIDQSGVNSLTLPWTALIRAKLLASFPEYALAIGPGWNANKSVVPAVYTSAPTVDTTDGGGLCGLTLDTLAHTPVLTIVTPNACTDIDLLYDNAASSGTFAYAVDGGGDNTITFTNTIQVLKATTALTGLSNTTHTVVAHNQSADSRNRVAGITMYPTGAKARGTGVGVGFWNTPGHSSNMYRTVAGQASYGIGVPQVWAGQAGITGFPVQPDLVFVMMGINDCSGHLVDPTRHFWIWDLFIRALRAGKPNCSIVIVTCSNPDTLFSGVSAPGFADNATWYEFVRVQHDLAKMHNCAHVNIHTRWGQNAAANGFYFNAGTGNAHPSTAGHTDIYNAILPLL